jgi:hypothetical protein
MPHRVSYMYHLGHGWYDIKVYSQREGDIQFLLYSRRVKGKENAQKLFDRWRVKRTFREALLEGL